MILRGTAGGPQILRCPKLVNRAKSALAELRRDVPEKFDSESRPEAICPKNMRGELAQARPVTFSAAATAAGTRIKSA